MKNALGKMLTVAALAVLSLVMCHSSLFAQSITFYQYGTVPPVTTNTPVVQTLMAWGGTQVGVAAPTQQIIVENTGVSTASTVVVSFTGTNSVDFSDTTSPATNCGGSLAAGATCTVTVTFTPGASGSRSGSLSVAGSNFTTATLPITGFGISLVPPTVSGYLTGFCTGTVGSGATDQLYQWGGVAAGCSTNSSAASGGFPMSHAGYLENLYISVVTAPGSGKTDVFTVYDGGTTTGITCSVVTTATSCHDTTHSYLVAAGDIITVSDATAASSALANPQFTLELH